MTEKAKKSFKEKFEITKQKVLRSLLAGFAAPFILILCTGFNLFFTNAEELGFSFGDLAPLWILLTLAVGLIFTATLLLTKNKAHKILFSLYSFLAVMGFVQYMVTTLTFKGLPADQGSVAIASTGIKITNLLLWVIVAFMFFYFGVMFKKLESSHRIITFLLVLVTVMQVFATVPNAITYISEKPKDNGSVVSYLSNEDMFEVSKKDNIIVFVVDRLDSEYFESFRKSYPTYLDKLDGFTYYSDNISTYPRTYPAITSMLTGINNPFAGRASYLNNAYKDSDFLKDISRSGYKINLYIPEYYAYDNAEVFNGIVSNTIDSNGHSISDPIALQTRMLHLSSYFWAPEVLKSTKINAKSFINIIDYNTESARYQMTETSDADVYKAFCEDGLSTQSKKGTFAFIHLRGSHAPATINENCEVVSTEGSYKYDDVVKQTAGMFKFITEYLDELKEKDLYEDATIIITGDHGALADDQLDYTKPVRTALLVKESGKADTPIKKSDAQVSQDNLHASIIKSAGITTKKDYGRAYWEIPENETVKRIHYFQTWGKITDQNVTYEITGPSKDFSNWKIVNRKDIGTLYK